MRIGNSSGQQPHFAVSDYRSGSDVGVFKVEADGNVGIGTTGPGYKLAIGSTDDSDQIGIYHDNTNAYFKTNDGSFSGQASGGETYSRQVSARFFSVFTLRTTPF